MTHVHASMVMARLTGAIVVLALAGPAFAQVNPCAESGPDCRLLTAAEVSAIKARLLALQAAMPVPDPARFAPPPDQNMAMTLDFIAELEAGGPMISGSWPGGAFTERNRVSGLYEGLAKAKPAEAKDPMAAAKLMEAMFGNRVEVLAKLLPHPFLVSVDDNGNCVDVTEYEATDIEKTSTFLSYIHSDGTSLRVIFGPRTCKEEQTIRVGKPSANLAPVMSISLEISAPNRVELLALKKKIDRKAFEALLGPLMK